MKKLIVCVFALCLLSVFPASAGVVLYSNGPINGTIDAWNIQIYQVTDSFVISSAATMTGFDFGSWNYSGEVISAIDWAVGTTSFGTDVASGSAAAVSGVFDYPNDSGYDIYTNTVSGLNVALAAGTYWLSLTNANTPDYAYWDENDGPSTAFQTSTGSIGSEAFDINGGSSVPEPGSMGLLSGGILVMLGALRRRKIG